MTCCMVAAKDDFCSGSAHHANTGMNPNHSYGGPGPGYFGQAGFGPGGPYPPHTGPMSPYQGGGPMSPYATAQNQPPPSGGGPSAQQQQQPHYGNQNSPFGNNQNQSSPYPGSYTNQSSGFHPQQPMQTYYNNHSPTHSVQHQFQFGGPGGAPPGSLRHPSPPRGPQPPPMGLMMGSRIPHPPINSPNQNLVTGNQMKKETADLKPGSMYSPASQGYSPQQPPYGYNGFGGTPGAGPPPRPMMSPMSPHGRLNISPHGQGGPPNLSPHEGPPSMSPHHPPMGPGLYSQPQNSPGNSSIVGTQASSFPVPSQHHQPYSAQYEYFGKQSQSSQMQQQSPLSSMSQGSSGGYGHKEDPVDPSRYPSDDRLSDVQSNASVRSSGGDTPKHNTFGDDSLGTSSLVKQEPGEQSSEHTTGDDNNPNRNSKQPGETTENFTDVKSEYIKQEYGVKQEPGTSYEDDCKDFTLKANQALIDNVNLDSIPELPEIPELKFADVNEVAGGSRGAGSESQDSTGKADLCDPRARSQHSTTSNPGVSPGSGVQEDSGQGMSPGQHQDEEHFNEFMDEHHKKEEETYHHNSMGFMHHLQGPLADMDGPMPSHFPPHHQMGGYPNQQQMWANFYNSGGVGGPPGDMAGRFPHPGMHHPGMDPGAPHMSMEGGWWGQQGQPQQEMGPYRRGAPGINPAPGAWALRGPRPRGERRGPGRPRLTTKGERGARPRQSTAGAGTPQFPTPFGIGQSEGAMMPGDEMLDTVGTGDMKRGPGRPKAIQDPNAPKAVTETTKNGNKKRYSCEVCQKRFSTAWYVRVHRRSHNGERPYICNNCGKGFMLPNVLQVHLRKCVKNNPPEGGGIPQGGPIPPGGQIPSQVGPIPSSPGNSSSQSPNNTASPNLNQPGQGNFGAFPDHHDSHGSIPQSQNQPFPGIGGFNQRYMGGMRSPPGHPPMSGPSPPYNQGIGPDIPPSFPPSDQGFNMPQGSPRNHSPVQFSPIYSPSNNLPKPNSDSGHFLANDKPRDKGGTGEKPVPPGVDPNLYCCACETSFEDKTSLEEHLKTHRPYSCEICEKRFSQKCNLITHMRLHTGEKPYNCQFCDKKFTQKGNLDAHLKTHTKEKPFHCMLCPKRFAFKSSMQSHVRGHQNGTSGPDDDIDEIDSIKEHMKMQEYERQFSNSDQTMGEEPDSPSLSPSLHDYDKNLCHNPLGVSNNTANLETDISKITDLRQSLAILQ